MKFGYKQIIAILIVFLLVFNLSVGVLANGGGENTTSETQSEPNKKVDIYLKTGKEEVITPYVWAWLVSVARVIAGAVIETITVTTIDAGLAKLDGWIGGSLTGEVVKVNNIELDAEDYKNWVCSTCVNSSYYVKLVQRSLWSLGYYKGSIDGSFGPLSKAAVIEFQRDYGIAQDGSVGPGTWKKLAHK